LMSKAFRLAVALLIVCACVAVAILAPNPAGRECVDIQVKASPNQAGSGEMRQTEKVRC
jgi:hypothetical protein